MSRVRIASLCGLLSLLAGCAVGEPSIPATGSPVDAPTPVSDLTPSGRVVDSSAAPSSAAPTPIPTESQSPASVRAMAATQAEVARLLSLVRVPAGSVEVRDPPSDLLDGPVMGSPMTSSLMVATGYWQVPLSLQATWDWFGAHRPGGLAQTGTSRGSSDWGKKDIVLGYGYAAPSSAAWTGAEIDIGMTAIDGTHTVVRADGVALWLDPTPVSDDQPGSRMYVTVAGGCPGSDQGYVGVTNPPPELNTTLVPPQQPTGGLVCRYFGMNDHPFALESHAVLGATEAEALAEKIGNLPLSHTDGDLVSCPFDDASTTVVAFAFPGRADVDLWVKANGCQTVANGFILAANDGTIQP
ncbi:MAG: hypothetical protein FWF28_02175 [Micrococcales bacterium]|nr:hypothetical protein [Micrococcales bacterium]